MRAKLKRRPETLAQALKRIELASRYLAWRDRLKHRPGWNMRANRRIDMEMVERVAKAIFEANSGKSRGETWEQAGGTVISSGVRKTSLREAYAAIKAMREPTEAMKARAASECGTTDVSSEEDFKELYGDVWSSMIDEALGTPE